ncbi:MAG TPA: MFS transporter [Thermomicrobiaceae bacterium]|nr:MFS transporter [Thermomicrobiaceae bacterium]
MSTTKLPETPEAERYPRQPPEASTGESRPGRSRLGRLARRRGPLWENTGFLHLWAAESVSTFGTQVTQVALPLAAVISLHASASQMGFLGAASTLPFLVFSLVAGAWIDRLRRKPLMIVADVGRALLLATIPIGWALGELTIPMLYAVAFLVGSLTVIFGIAWVPILPSIVAHDELVEANGRLNASDSFAQAAGPGVAGLLIGAISAPFALSLDAASYVFSALFLSRIRVEEETIPAHPERKIVGEIAAGIRVTLGHRVLRALTAASATTSLSGQLFLAVYVIYMARDLGLGSTAIGLVFSAGGVGALIGAVLSGPLTRRFGIGPTILGSLLLFGLAGIPITVTLLTSVYPVPLVVLSEFFSWLFLTIYYTDGLSVRQSIVPNRLQGRVTATYRFLSTGAGPLGSILGGLLGQYLGVRTGVLIGTIGFAIPVLWVLVSPVGSMRDVAEYRGSVAEE